MKKALSAKLVSSLETKDKAYIVFDASVRGFGVKVQPSGTRTYVLRYRVGKDAPRQITIGDAGSMSLTSARDIAMEMYTQTRKGICPLAEKRACDRTMTVQQLWEQFKTEKVLAAKTLENYTSQFNRYIGPLLGKRVIGAADISKRVKDMHTAIARATPAQANGVVNLLKQMYSFATYKEYIAANPINVEMAEMKKFNTTMTREEAIAVWNACDTVAAAKRSGSRWWIICHAFQMMIATGCRKGEIIEHLRWSQHYGDRFVVPWSKLKQGRKTRKDMDVYTSDLTDAILAKVPRSGDLVFGVDGVAVASGHDTRLWQEVLAEAGITRRVRIHDIRHTFASLAGNSKTLTLKDVSLLLNHQKMSTTERYVHFFDDTKEDAAKRMAKSLTSLFSIQPDDQSAQTGD